MGANGRGSKVGRIDPSHRDTSARPTPGPHIGFICLPTLIIAQTHPAWRDRFASTPSKLYLRADYRRRMMQKFWPWASRFHLPASGHAGHKVRPASATPPPAKTTPTHAAHATSRSTVQRSKTRSRRQIALRHRSGRVGRHSCSRAARSGTECQARPHTAPTCPRGLQSMPATTGQANRRPLQRVRYRLCTSCSL